MRFCPLKQKSIEFENVSFRVFTPKNIISFCGFSYILKRISSKNIELVYAQQCRIRRIGFFVHIRFWFCRGYGSTPCSLFWKISQKEASLLHSWDFFQSNIPRTHQNFRFYKNYKIACTWTLWCIKTMWFFIEQSFLVMGISSYLRVWIIVITRDSRHVG